MLKGKQREKTKRKPIRRFFKTFVDVKRWISYEELSTSVKTTLTIYQRFFGNKTKNRHPETYEEAVARLHLSSAQLAHRTKIFLYTALIYWGLALGLLSYLFYLLHHKFFSAALLDTILVVLAIMLAYREHFWYMQMRIKRLGCNFSDWVAFILGRKR